MRRREFIVLLGGSALSWSPPLRAQQAAALPTIGFLGVATPSTQKDGVVAFLKRLRELGWIEGRTVAIEYRWAEGRSEVFAELAAELVRLHVAVIVTGGAAAVFAAKQATSTIPIVFTVVSALGATCLIQIKQSSNDRILTRHRPEHLRCTRTLAKCGTHCRL
jgi:putative ABC transport system substrate-binding protein